MIHYKTDTSKLGEAMEPISGVKFKSLSPKVPAGVIPIEYNEVNDTAQLTQEKITVKIGKYTGKCSLVSDRINFDKININSCDSKITFINGMSFEMVVASRGFVPLIIYPQNENLEQRHVNKFVIIRTIVLNGTSAINYAKAYINNLRGQICDPQLFALKEQLNEIRTIAKTVELTIESFFTQEEILENDGPIHDFLTDYCLFRLNSDNCYIHPFNDQSEQALEQELKTIQNDGSDTQIASICYITNNPEATDQYTNILGKVLRLKPIIKNKPATSNTNEQLLEYIQVTFMHIVNGSNTKKKHIYSLDEANKLFGLFDSKKTAECMGDYKSIHDRNMKDAETAHAAKLREEKNNHMLELEKIQQKHKLELDRQKAEQDILMANREREQKLEYERQFATLRELSDLRKQQHEINNNTRKSNTDAIKLIGAILVSVLAIITAIIKFLPTVGSLV